MTTNPSSPRASLWALSQSSQSQVRARFRFYTQYFDMNNISACEYEDLSPDDDFNS